MKKEHPVRYTLGQIKNALKNIIDKILIERYPYLKQIKENNINFCIEEYPYLAKYIKEIANDFVLPSIGTLLDKAMSKFKEEKENVKNKFKQMLSNKKIDTKDFENNIKKLSDICNRELAQYFCYRQSIISALNKLNEENNKKEELLHNLFIPKGTVITNIPEDVIQKIEDWINNLLRPMFGFKSSLEMAKLAL